MRIIVRPAEAAIIRFEISCDSHDDILGDPAAVSGAGKTLNGGQKKFGRRKVKNEKKSFLQQELKS